MNPRDTRRIMPKGVRQRLLNAAIAAGLLLACSADPASADILSSKRGFADTGASYSYLQAINAGWYYRWGPNKPNVGGFDALFVPMFWGGYQVNQETIDTIIGYGDTEWVLGFNEPERSDQANMSVSYAISKWQELQSGFAGTGIKLVSPAVSDNSAGQSWLSSFMSQANSQNLKVDAVAFHWYGASSPNDPIGAANSFIGRVDSYHNSYGKPVWITEFAMHDWGGNYSDEEMRAANAIFLGNVIPRLESRSYVIGYAWYHWFGDAKLVEGSPLLPTNVGMEYVGVVRNGEVYDFAGENLGEHIAYLLNGDLTLSSQGAIVRYINALDGTNAISGFEPWGIDEGGWVRVQPSAILQKTSSNRITWNDITVINKGVIEVLDGALRIQDLPEFTDSNIIYVLPGGTLEYHASRGSQAPIENHALLVGGALATELVNGFRMRSSGTISGTGLVSQSIDARDNALIRVGGEGMPVRPSQYVVDDFQSYAAGLLRDVASPPWTAHDDTSFASVQSEASNANQMMGFGWTDNYRGASMTLPREGRIEEGDTATFFFRFRSLTDDPDHNVGLADRAATSEVNFSDFEAQVRIYSDGDSAPGTFGLDARDGGGFIDLVDSLQTNTWYNVWLVIDQDTDTMDVYLNTGAADATPGAKLNAAPLALRNGTPRALDRFLAYAGSAPQNYSVQIDDLVYLHGVDLSNPLSGLAPYNVYEDASLTVTGNVTMESGTTLELGITDAVACDKITISGDLNAGGTLHVMLADNTPTPEVGASFDLIDAAAFNGAFDVLALPQLPAGMLWDVRNLYLDGSISVIDSATALAETVDCLTGPAVAATVGCDAKDIDVDGDVDLLDCAIAEKCFNAAGNVFTGVCAGE